MLSFTSAIKFSLVFVCIIAFVYNARAANATVKCGSKGAHSKITSVLKLLHPEEPNIMTSELSHRGRGTGRPGVIRNSRYSEAFENQAQGALVLIEGR